jgi:hypothetical protein
MALSLPDPTYESESTRRLYPRLPLFDGFPYLAPAWCRPCTTSCWCPRRRASLS